MRVLWIVPSTGNYIPVGGRESGYNGGGWISSIQNRFVKQNDIQLGITLCMNGQPEKVVQNGVTYYIIPNHRKRLKDKLIDLLKANDVKRDEILWPHYTSRLKQAIDDFRPDVIHIFGSELYQQLAALVTGDIPSVLHIQGLLSLSIYILLPPGISRYKFIMSGKGLRGKFAKYQYLAYWQRSVHREKIILRAVNHFIGRTDWDRHGVNVINPNATYHYGGEILRDVFYNEAKRNIPSKPIITTTISSALYKGFDVVLKVADILKNEMHLDFEWNVFGNVSPALIEKTTSLRHQGLNIRLHGVASAETIYQNLVGSTLYFHPSYVENSPNAVGEAQLVGIPVVASNVGGTSSMVEHGKTGYLYPATDPYSAAYYIGKLIANKEENIRIGEEASKVARVRHNPEEIIKDLLETYKGILKE